MKKEYTKPELSTLECELESAYLLMEFATSKIPYGGEADEEDDPNITPQY